MSDEQFNPRLLALLREAITVGETVSTLSLGRSNRIVDISPEGVLIETERSKNLGSGPQMVPAWMVQVAWDRLQERGVLTNSELLSGDELNVKRSSAVCALLARLPGVEVVSRRPTALRLVSSAGSPNRGD